MFTRYVFVVLFLLAVLEIPSKAQEGAQQDAAATPLQDTAIPSLQGGTLAFEAELARTNYLNYGFSVGTTFDDNALNTSSDRLSDLGYSISPYIALRQSRGRLNWALDFATGFTMNQRLSDRNQGSQDLGFESIYRLSPHVNLLLRDRFLNTTGFFDPLNQNSTVSSGTVLQSPNRAVITPLARQTSNTATGQITYQFSRDSEVGLSGTFYRSHYRDAPIGTTLIDSNTQEAEASYSHRIFGRDSIGVRYRFQRLTFSPAADNVLVHSALAMYTLRPSRTVSLSLFAGPQYTSSSTELIVPTVQLPVVYLAAISVSDKSWSPAMGASFAWNGRRTSVTADVSRTIRDGGGLLGAVKFTTLDAGVRRQLTRNYSAELGMVYGLNNSVGVSTQPYSAVKSLTGSFSLSRRLGTNFGFTMGYARVYQLQDYAAPGSETVNHNRAWVTISYEFSRPLGR